MAALTTDSKALILAWLLTTGTAVRPTAWYMALHTGDPGATGATNEVTTGIDSDYVRKTITFAAPAAGQDLNSTSPSWTANSGATSHTVTHASIWSAPTGGTCLLKGALLASRVRAASGVLTFNIGDIVAAAS